MSNQHIRQVLAVAMCVCAVSAVRAAQETIYVDAAATGASDGSSWADAYVSLQAALAATPGEGKLVEIRVAQGTYRPDESIRPPRGELPMFLLPSGTVLRGGYAGLAAADANTRDVSLYRTVLKPVERNSVLPRYVIAARETGPGTTLDGVIVSEGDVGMEIVDANVLILNCGFEGSVENGIFCQRNGNIRLYDCYFAHHAQCAVNVLSSQATFSNCLFEQNVGGLPFPSAIESMGGTLVAVDCTFRANEGAVVDGFGTADLLRCEFVDNSIEHQETLNWSGTATVRQCRFESNTSWGSGKVLWLVGDATVADCEFTGNSIGIAVLRTGGTVASVTRCTFIGNTYEEGSGSPIESRAALTHISHCLFTGNSGGPFNSGTIDGIGATLEVSNCTFADNRAQSNAIGGYWENVSLTQCILQDVPNLFDDSLLDPENIAVTYSNIEGGYPGSGNIDLAPEFVRPGYWADPNDLDVEVGSDDPQAVWVMGDYHLQSQAGHWDRGTETWVFDDTTSPCIDAGDPNGYLGSESFPNGGYVNLGAYGGTLEASRSYFGKPVCENQLAGDINGDCIVDQTDIDILLSHWLMDSTEVANIPPVIRIVSPVDGAELTYPDPIELRVETSDPDGYVWKVSYQLEASTDTGSQIISAVGDSESEDWTASLEWSSIHRDAPFTITATAVDNRGVETTSAPITVTLHP